MPPSRCLRLRGVTKRFGPVQALTAVDLDIPAGQVTALAGDNGAGKSVLIKCIAGIHAPEDGQISWEGKPVHLRTPRDAAALGIETVYQDLALCDNLDIVQNMFLGRERLRHRVLDEEDMETAARETLSSLRGDDRPLDPPAGRVAVRRAAAVRGDREGRPVGREARDHGRTDRRARRDADGAWCSSWSGASPIAAIAVLLVSHNLNDVFQVADRIAVLYLGRMVAVRPAAEMDRQIVVDLMTSGASTRSAPAGGGG